MPARPLDLRYWLAQLHLQLGVKADKTRLLYAQHVGPLRVQRAFYPEGALCHLYWLHPPGGLVTGDELHLTLHLEAGAQALLTTPSAGKVYAVKSSPEPQVTRMDLQLAAGAQLEWLPQETLVFEGADAQLHTRIQMAPGASVFAWDIVCLGRPAAGEAFAAGSCRQNLEVWRDGVPLLIERNQLLGGSALLHAPWGLQGANSLGTCVASVTPGREALEALQVALDALSQSQGDHKWGITQKGELCILRYLGPSASHCRLGFERAWQLLRPLFNQRPACPPRIWAT
jgi:urease accessory protein